jgi:hypothetical protein
LPKIFGSKQMNLRNTFDPPMNLGNTFDPPMNLGNTFGPPMNLGNTFGSPIVKMPIRGFRGQRGASRAFKKSPQV